MLDFPIKDQIRTYESGQGYALRMAFENQLNGLPQIKGWLGKSRYAVLDQADARLLHRWFGADEGALGKALGQTTTGVGYETYTIAGHSLSRSYFINRSYPRVCIQCLSAYGFCACSWDLSLVVACSIHGTLLTDHCPHCQRQLSWHRPGPDACICGCNLSSHANHATEQPSDTPSALEIKFGEWASHAMYRPDTTGEKTCLARQALDGDGLMQFLRGMSLNGGLLFTHALACAAGYGDLETHDRRRPQRPLKKARRSLSSANQVARILSKDWQSIVITERPSVVIHLLADCMAAHMPETDRSLANSLLSTMFFQRRKIGWKSRFPQLSQLELFE
ncbi:MAG: TniQ family protein [Gammaproteobacteria bacterium]|nr:TniQ family protein [Gammaproteobacteria bacterium]MBU1506827.1 TniQ family protein [Gammaproteobacteria bacterium]MBU2202292.1 TniQ family protein [Gammaproteobacteria bacterium]MBU2277126.1 TniQ family protein [Gammaproteobacteria bacterium]MBU2356251.1 TniQ family protein [Gammaproteobacteria bacterium]